MDLMTFQLHAGTAGGLGTDMRAGSSCEDHQHKKCRLRSTSDMGFSIFFVLYKGGT